MKRFVVSIVGAAFLMVVTGCGGGTVEEGLPPSTKSDVPLDAVPTQMSKDINKNALPKGSETGEAAKKK